MRILVIGGTGFIGPWVVAELQRTGHTVAVLHRGTSKAQFAPGVERIIGDRRHLAASREDIRRFAPDVVIDLILSSGRQAEDLMNAVRGIARRVVAIGSMDVYRAFAVVQGLDSGPLEPLPITEDSPLRTIAPYPPEVLRNLQKIFGWLDDEYDKIPVERATLNDAALPGTVLRLPMVYGPGDPLHRFYPMLKRIADGRQAVIFPEQAAAWRAPRGYVEDMAVAIALAATSGKAAGRVYNVCEEQSYSELEWAKKIGNEAGWHGRFIVLPKERTPRHLIVPGNLAQHGVTTSERIRRELGYRETVGTLEGIRRTIAWEKATPPTIPLPYQFDYPAEDAAAEFAST